MTAGALFQKDPDERLDYVVDFERWLEGDVIATATAAVANSTAAIEQTDTFSQAVRVWISGGAAGEVATVTVTATTVQGRVKEACFRLRVRDCG